MPAASFRTTAKAITNSMQRYIIAKYYTYEVLVVHVAFDGGFIMPPSVFIL